MIWAIVILGVTGIIGWILAVCERARAEAYREKCLELVGTMKAMVEKVKDPKCD